jgi:hypothetical protein
MEDFIRVWPNLIDPVLCQETIDSFESIVQNSEFKEHITNNALQFDNKNLGRKDLSIFLETAVYNKFDICNRYLYYLQDCLMEYIDEFGQLASVSMSNRMNIKVQRTMPLGGYHQWHYENGDGPNSHARELVWMIYLNDMPEGEAETEFLFQCRKIRPTQGTVVMWPAGMTHVHRGLTVYTQPKYIATGWYYKTKQTD